MKDNELIYDRLHVETMNKYLMELKSDPSNIRDGSIFEIEYYYNYFGERGSIDILRKADRDYCGKCDRVHKLLEFYEIKPYIFDIGNTIRQIKKYFFVLEKIFQNIPCHRGRLVLPFNNKNSKHFLENYEIYKHAFQTLPFFSLIFFDAPLFGGGSLRTISFHFWVEDNDYSLNRLKSSEGMI